MPPVCFRQSLVKRFLSYLLPNLLTLMMVMVEKTSLKHTKFQCYSQWAIVPTTKRKHFKSHAKELHLYKEILLFPIRMLFTIHQSPIPSPQPLPLQSKSRYSSDMQYLGHRENQLEPSYWSYWIWVFQLEDWNRRREDLFTYFQMIHFRLGISFLDMPLA